LILLELLPRLERGTSIRCCEQPAPVPGVTVPGAACGHPQTGGVYAACWGTLSLAFTLPSYR